LSQTPSGPGDAWKIPTAAATCSVCETELVTGSEVTVVLSLGEDGPGRHDVCSGCEPPETANGIFWRHKVPDLGDGKPVVDYAMLREIFGRLVERPEESYRRLSYLVALVLVRKRHLRLLGFEARGGKEVMRVSRGAGEPAVDVPAPYLSADDMVETRDMLTRLLAADLPDEGLLAPAALAETEPAVETEAASEDPAAAEADSAAEPVADGDDVAEA
jgi:hypothetical protein